MTRSVLSSSLSQQAGQQPAIANQGARALNKFSPEALSLLLIPEQ
jgi:hypothetical protein